MGRYDVADGWMQFDEGWDRCYWSIDSDEADLKTSPDTIDRV